MSSGHVHARPGHESRLWLVLTLTASFLVAELIAAWWTGSLALLSDAAHMSTDVVALAIALTAIRVARRGADSRRTFGYERFEIIAAALNAVLLLAVAVYIVIEAYKRLRAPAAIHASGMLIVAVLGLAVNLISMRLLHQASGESVNLRGAYLEVWGDMLGSLGVIVAASIIFLTGWLWVDAAIAAGIGSWMVPRAWKLLKETVNVLLQGVPQGIDLHAIETAILQVEGISEIHDLHVWSLTSGRHVLSVHVVMHATQGTEQQMLAEIDQAIRRFGIRHTTIQVERESLRSCERQHSASTDENSRDATPGRHGQA